MVFSNKHNFNKYVNTNKNKNIRVGLLISGFAPRSLKYTHKSIYKNIIVVLKKHFDTDIYMFSLLSKNIPTKDNKQILKLLSTNATKYEYQEDLNANIEFTSILNCIREAPLNISNKQIINFIRDLYQEYKTIDMINLNKYDVCITIGPDYYITDKININEIIKCVDNTRINSNEYKAYTTQYNKCGGIPNKFLIAPSIVTKLIMERYKATIEWCNFITNKKQISNPERFVEYIFNKYKIANIGSTFFYIKIRENG